MFACVTSLAHALELYIVDLQLSAAVGRAPVAIAHAEPCKIYEVTGMLLD